MPSLTARKDETGDSGGSHATAKDLLCFGRILDLDPGVPRDHKHTDRLEFLDSEESSGASMPIT